MIPSNIFNIRVRIYSLAILITLGTACNNSSDPDFNYNKISNAGDSAKSDSQILVPENKIPSNLVSTSPTTTTNGINPPHGQPGHRCDIAEGAPLNNQPATTPVQQKQPNIITTTAPATPPVQQKPAQQVTPTKTTTAPGMNPPHGEPGHRCEIAVGAPLNSKPTTPTSTPTTPVKQPTTVATKTVTAPGMNPPHGEPGHRCDIGVGTPLSQPVKTNTVSPIIKDSPKK